MMHTKTALWKSAATHDVIKDLQNQFDPFRSQKSLEGIQEEIGLFASGR